MLQQTQVKTVIPFYERWMAALPDVRTLAGVSEPELLKLWEGLGYYHRVRRMREAARLIMNTHGGRFPSSHADVLQLPGVGAYTAGAICSIAFNQPQPILDGNVIRVLTRLLGIRESVSGSQVRDRLWREAQALAEHAATAKLPSSWSRRSRETGMRLSGPCSALNQALMELGAVVCLPRNPKCEACPVRESCACAAAGAQDVIPVLPEKPSVTKRTVVVCVVEREGKLLVRQRAGDVHNTGFWEFPEAPVAAREKQPAALSRLLGMDQAVLRPDHVGAVRHSITRYRYMFDIYHVRLAPDETLLAPNLASGGSWVTMSQLDALPLAGPHRKVLAKLQALPVRPSRAQSGKTAST